MTSTEPRVDHRGEKSLDTDWEQYRKQVMDAGMSKVTVEANQSWKNLSSTLPIIDSNI